MLTIQEWCVYNKAVDNHVTALGVLAIQERCVGNTGMVCWQYRNERPLGRNREVGNAEIVRWQYGLVRWQYGKGGIVRIFWCMSSFH